MPSVETVGGATATGNTAITSSSETLVSSNLLLVALSFGDSHFSGPTPSILSVTWSVGSQAMSLVASSGISDGTWSSVIWYYLNNPNPGTGTVTATFGDTLGQIAIHVAGVIGAGTLRTPSTANGFTADPAVTVGNAVAGDLIVAVVSNDNNNGVITEANTLIFEAEDLGSDTNHNSQYKTATGGDTMSWTNLVSDPAVGWAASAFAIAASAGGPQLFPQSSF